MKIISNCLELFPIKLLLVVGYIGGIAFVNWLIHSDGVPVSKRCSPDYPEFAVELEYPDFLPDGEVKDESSGEIYPRGAWWKRGKEIWGCPCSLGKPCLRKCCALGEDWKLIHIHHDNNFEHYCRKPITGSNITDSLLVYEKRYAPPRYEPVKVSPDHFKFYHKTCHGSLDFFGQLTTRLILLEDGTLQDTVDKFIFDQSHFCVEHVEGLHTMFYFCYKLENIKINLLQSHNLLYWLIMITSLIILMLTLLVYALVPRLRRGYGIPIMCYLATETVNKLTILFKFLQLKPTYLVYQDIYVSLSAEVWAVVVSYHMWSLVGSVKIRPRILLDCVLALGTPLVVLVVVVVADLVPGVPDIAKPILIGEDRIQSSSGKLLYYIFPMMALEMASLVLCVATLVRLAASKRNADALQGPDSSRHNANEVQWSSLYLKVCLILGVNYLIYNTLFFLSWIIFLHPILHNTLALTIGSRGVEVFIIFVCKKDILYSFCERLAFWRK